jgi:hypothetical protein
VGVEVVGEMFSFEKWKAMNAKRRQQWLSITDSTDADEEEKQLLSNIAEPLRRVDFESVEGWERIQAVYEKRPKKWSSSARSSLDFSIKEAIKEISNNMEKVIADKMDNVTSELEKLRLENQEIKEENMAIRQAQEVRTPNQAILLISGQTEYYKDILKPYTSHKNPNYEVFEVINDFERTLRRFFIQPHHAVFGSQNNDYHDAVTHFVSIQDSPISELLTSASNISITFHCQISGVNKNFTFREYPDSDHRLADYVDILYDDEAGSDTMGLNMRTHIMAVSVNTVSPYAGGSPTDQRISWLKTYDYRKTYDNSCFYACIREIWRCMSLKNKVKQYTYEKMRVLLTDSINDKAVTIDMLAKAEKLFDVKFIVLSANPPTVVYHKPPRSERSYEEISGSYTITYDTLYFDGSHHVLMESDTQPLELNKKDRSLYLELNGEEYFILVLQNNHYSNVSNIARPVICMKCGSRQHKTEDTIKSEVIKLECLENLQDSLTSDEYDKAYPETAIVTFDIETVTKEGVLIPYSISWKVGDTMYNETGYGCDVKFVKALSSMQGVKTLVGFNSSRFDNYILVKRLLLDGKMLNSNNCTVHNNQILRLNTREYKTWDVCQFTKCSLNAACEAFGVDETKSEFDHDYIQNLFEEHGWEFINIIGKDKIEKYNNNDVALTVKVFDKVRESLNTITGIDSLKCMTLSQLAYKHMLSYNKNKIEIDKLPIEYDYIFDTIPAGRVEMFKAAGRYHGSYVQSDCNGLYQYVSLHYDMPNGVITRTGRYDGDKIKDRIYLARCNVDQTHLSIKLVGVKILDGDRKGRIEWKRDRVQDAWLWGEEINALEKLGCKVEKYETLIWNEKIKPFEVMNLYKDIRRKEKEAGRGGGVVDNMAKLLSNAITGKTYQRNIREEWTIASSLSEVEAFKKNHHAVYFDTTDINGKYYINGIKNTPQTVIDKPRHIGARIYAMARLYMFEIIKDLKSIMYMDTDGFIMERKEYAYNPILQESNELGGFKIEADGDIVYLFSLKNYAICDSTKEVCMKTPHTSKKELKECKLHHNKYRLKGYHNSDPWVSTSQKYEGTYVCENMYKALLNDGPVKTHTSKIIKKFVCKTSDGPYNLSTLYGQRQERIIA